MQGRRVVVTGMGCISPVGNTVAQAWRAITAGKSGIGQITRFNTEGYPVTFGGSVKAFDGETLFGKKRMSQNGCLYPVWIGLGD